MISLITSILPSFTSLLLVLTATLLYWYCIRKRSRIPGPYCLPLVGYLPFIGKEPHKTFVELAKKYGNVFRLKLGMVDVVVLNDWESIKEALSKDEFLGRPQQTIFNAYTEDVSFAFLEGHEWKEQRRFAMRTLKDLGFAKALMENQIVESVAELCDYIEKQNREPKKLLTWIHGTSLNVVLEFFAGKRYNFEDKDFSRILHTAVGNEESTNLVDIAAYYPALAQILAKYQVFGFDKFKELVDLLIDFSEKRVVEVENSLEGHENKSYITEFLAEIAENEKLGKLSSFNRTRLVVTLYDFMLGGVDTVGALIAWIFVIVCYFPKCQQRVQEEIDAVVGNRSPRFADRHEMVYTQAVILEVQRWISFIPLDLPRRTIKNAHVKGIPIPEDTQVLINFYAVHMDGQMWENVNEFEPERFISEDGQRIVNQEMVLTFSYGKRDCSGKLMANAELFLYTTHLLQKYSIATVSGKRPSLDYSANITLQPLSMDLKFVPRSEYGFS